MASNNGSNRISLPQRKNGNNRKNRDNQDKIIRQLMEMFGTTFEADIIASVAQTCHWKLDQSIDTLITLSSSAQTPKSSTDPPAYDPWTADEYPSLQETQEIFPSASGDEDHDNKSATEQKVETASLCGLKVEYRPKGMENNSDDDADVVIEEESNDYRLNTPEPTQRSVNVCQFLETPPVQCPPKNTLTKVNYINTASPPRSPARNNNNNSPKLSPLQVCIESDIRKGFKVLLLLRGCPGSGKSYLAKEIVTRTCGEGSDFSKFIFSTDDFFSMINRGVYAFDASKLSDAHTFNKNRVLNAVRQGWSPIIVDNTNTQSWEMQDYVVMGVKNGYIIETLEPSTPWSRNAAELERRNKHGVPKSKIRVMLERFEPGLSGDELIRMFRLTYNSDNKPPQLRKLPSLPKNEPQSEKQVRPVSQEYLQRSKTSVENAPQVCNALSTIAKEYSNLETVATPPSTISTSIDIVSDTTVDKQPNSDIWTEGSSYKEDNLLDLTKLGAIGSERRVSNAGIGSSTSNIQKISVNSNQVEKTLITLESASDEQKSILNEREEVPSRDNGLSQCWDFTLWLNGVQIHSKLDEKAPITAESDVTETDRQQILLTQNTELLDEKKSDDAMKDQASPSDSSSSGSLDMSQFEICNKPEITTSAAAAETINENQSSVGSLGSIFSYIKNSFLGNEKDKVRRQENEDDADVSKNSLNSTDRLTAKLKSSSINDVNPQLSIVSHNAAIDSLSSKLSSTSISSITEMKNLKHEAQESSDLSESVSTLVLLEESNEVFETHNNMPPETTTRVVEELLEASSDFQLVEQIDEFVTEVKEKKEELDDKFVSDKNFAEQIKNLQVLVKFEEDDSKVLKEPIDKVFGGKNIFTEKIQNMRSSSIPMSKPNNSNNVNNNINNNNNNLIDNVNLISWQDSPFPLEEVVNSVTNTETNSKKPETCDRETYTDIYDFNVAFVGGTEDYKVLEAFNRSINKPGQRTPDERSTHKLLLHKGTMTRNTSVLLHGERCFEYLNPTEETISKDRSEELVECYPQLPRACVLDVYENCQRDFNWALDYLDSLQHDQATVTAAVEQHIAESEAEVAGLPVEHLVKTVQVPIAVPPRFSESSSSSSLSSSPQRQRNKKDKISSSDAQIALKREFEDKFVLSKESYKPHTLRVKRWKNRESERINRKLTKPEVEQVPETSPCRKPSRLDHPAVEEDLNDNEEEEEEDIMEDEPEETIELQLGYEFIRVLEEEFGSGGAGNDNFQPPDGLFPVIQIRKSMAQELHALWIESMERQLNFMHEQLDAMIAKDAEYARSLEAEEARAISDEKEPNLKEIMDMEMALATFSNDRKEKLKKESYGDMTSRVTERTLHDMFPNYEREFLHQIYEAHDRNFDETVRIIEENCSGKSNITMADVLKKRKTLIDELQKESSYQTSKHNQLDDEDGPDEASGGIEETENEDTTYDDVMSLASASRDEAKRQLALRNVNYQKACEAYRSKNPEVAAYYADVAKLHIKKMEQAHDTAASAYLAAQAFVQNDDTLDLHNLRVEEALLALDIFLEHQFGNMTKSARKTIFIITGRGARSPNRQSRIKPAVALKLNQKSINFEEANPGMLRVYLRKK